MVSGVHDVQGSGFRSRRVGLRGVRWGFVHDEGGRLDARERARGLHLQRASNINSKLQRASNVNSKRIFIIGGVNL